MPDPRKPRPVLPDASRVVPTPKRERPARLSREALAERIRQQNEQAADEALPFGWKLALFASRLNENINPVILAQQIAKELTPSAIAERRADPEWQRFLRERPGTVTPEQLAQAGRTVGGAVGSITKHLVGGVARGDPAALADAAATVAPIVGPKLYGATRFAKARAANAAAARTAADIASGSVRSAADRHIARIARGPRSAVSESMERINRSFDRPENIREPHLPEGAPAVLGATNPIESLVNEYRATRGITSEPLPPVTQADDAAHRALAKYYDDTPSQHNDPRVRASYDALWRVIEDQYEFLKSKGYRMEVVDSPDIQSVYNTPEEMFDDITNNKRLKINATNAEQANLPAGQKPVVEGQAHPIWTNHQNNVFRFVHDLLGHGATRRGFDLPGEETAFRAHAMTMPKEAMPALVSETRGQTATYFHGRNPNTFVEQKALAFPESMHGDYATINASRPPLLRAAEEGLAGTGFTVDATGRPYKGTGFAVADPNFTKILDESNPNAIEDFINDPAVQAELKKPNRHLGGWRDPQTGKREINVTTTFNDDQFPAAVAFARQGKQKTIGEFKDGQYVRDRQYIASPAIIGADGVTYRGANHELARAAAAKAMRATPEGMAAMRANGGNAQKRGTVDGFVTGDESFVDRAQGRLLAPDAEGRAYRELHSSDLNLPEQSHAAEYPVQVPEPEGVQNHPLFSEWASHRPISGETFDEFVLRKAEQERTKRMIPTPYPDYSLDYEQFKLDQPRILEEQADARARSGMNELLAPSPEPQPLAPLRPDVGDPKVSPDVVDAPPANRPDLEGFIGTGANSMTPTDVANTRVFGAAPAGPPVGEIADIPLSDVLESQRSFNEASVDVSQGRGSKTSGPVRFHRLEDGRLLLVDGHHRFVDAVRRGDKTIKGEVVSEGYSDYWATPRPEDTFQLPKRRTSAPAPAGPPVLGGHWKALDDLLPYFSGDEILRILSPRGTLLRNSIDARARLLGPDEPLIAAALQGQLARGGYESVIPELRALYGPDAERFAGIWAAVSPRQRNEAALGMTRDIFGRWRELGGLSASPNDLQALANMTDLIEARGPNTLRALTAVDPLGLQLSGNKVESFFPNLLGHLNPRVNLNRVTLDALQGAGMGINPARFGNYGTYLTGSAQVRRVADALSRGTGVPWAPAEAQEAMWSTIRALENLPGAEAAAARGTLPEMMRLVTPEMAGNQWSAQVFRDALTEGGAMGSDITPSLRFQLGEPNDLRLLAESVQNSLRKRYRIR